MELFKLTIENYNIVAYCNPYLLGTFAVIGIGILICKIFHNRNIVTHEIDINEIELGIGNQKLKIKPNYQTKQVAYKLWVELNTRKLGLPIDENNDVISEIYDSWYSFFGIARELIKDIPAQKVTNTDTKELIILSSKILNKAIRPHLTKWQARYREWYKRQLESIDYYDISPQDLQKKFKCFGDKSCYQTLIADMKSVNKKIISYRKILEQIVFGEELQLEEQKS